MTPHKLLSGLILAGAVILAASQTLAADKDKPKATAEPNLEAYLKAAQPGPEHKRLEPLAGSWNVGVKMWMDPSKPPTESKGTAERKWILGGRFLQEAVKGEFLGQPFEGGGLTGYDNLQKKYIGVWVDNMSTGMSHSVGTADESGKVFTFTREDFDPVSGKKVKSRDIIRIESEDKHSMDMFKEGPDGKEIKGMELVFTRKGKAATK
jgi:hypothetical protein